MTKEQAKEIVRKEVRAYANEEDLEMIIGDLLDDIEEKGGEIYQALITLWGDEWEDRFYHAIYQGDVV